MNWESYLESIYFDPKHPASFAGPIKLYDTVKQEGTYDIGLSRIRSWLQNQEAYSLHKPLRHKFKTNRVMVEGIDDQWDADLMDMTFYASKNDGYNYILTVIDIFSKYAWLRPLKTKTSSEVKAAFESIKRKPNLLRTDKGKEFTSNIIEKFFKTAGIHHFVTQNVGKANYAERVIKTIKNHLQRYMTHHQTHRYIDIVPDVNKSYNLSYHTTIGMAPSEVNKDNERAIWWMTYWPKKKIKKQTFKFDVGNLVRITYLTNVFTREYDEKWTGEIFKIARRFRREGLVLYKLNDFEDEPIKGTFYQPELQKISIKDDKLWKIEKVIKTRKRRGKTEYFVKWKHWPKKFNSWIQDIKK